MRAVCAMESHPFDIKDNKEKDELITEPSGPWCMCVNTLYTVHCHAKTINCGHLHARIKERSVGGGGGGGGGSERL